MHQFDFGWGCAPDPAGELTVLPQTPITALTGFNGGLLLREGRERRAREGWAREGRRDGRGPTLKARVRGEKGRGGLIPQT